MVKVNDNKFSSDITDEESEVEHLYTSQNSTACSGNELNSDGKNGLAAAHVWHEVQHDDVTPPHFSFTVIASLECKQVYLCVFIFFYSVN